MPDRARTFGDYAADIFTAPARFMAATPRPTGLADRGGLTGAIFGLHEAIDPVQNFGGYGNVGAMALPMGGATSAAKVPWVTAKLGRRGAVPNVDPAFTTERKLPSGVTVYADNYRRKTGGLRADFGFHDESRKGFGFGMSNPKAGIQRLGEVADSIREYVGKVQPEKVTFSAASKSLEKLYDRMAPRLAKELGGELTTKKPTSSGREYEITFKDFKQWFKTKGE